MCSLGIDTVWETTTLYELFSPLTKACTADLKYSDDLGVSLRIKYGFLLNVCKFLNYAGGRVFTSVIGLYGEEQVACVPYRVTVRLMSSLVSISWYI